MMFAKYNQPVQSRIDDYLQAVRDRLGGSKSVDAQEVVDELGGHIERELSSLGESVSVSDVEEILDRLGPHQAVRRRLGGGVDRRLADG